MNDLNRIQCMLYRAGTSKGAFFLEKDLPLEKEERDNLLLKIMGSPDVKQIDGIGGATSVTTKTAIISPSKREGIDVDYKFLQVMLDTPTVDDKPTCGNILTAVGVFALERGLCNIEDGETIVNIYDVNTGANISQVIQTPNRTISYKGSQSIAGVPGSAAPIELFFKNITGGKTGHYLPTGNKRDIINGIEISCLDISMPVVFVKASDLDITGHEAPEELNINKVLFQEIEDIREQASHLMGLGSAKGNVIPKIAVVSSAKSEADINIRYFTPFETHPSIAVSAAFCVAVGSFVEGTLLNEIKSNDLIEGAYTVSVENPSGITEVDVTFPSLDISEVEGKTTRTARLLFNGEVYV